MATAIEEQDEQQYSDLPPGAKVVSAPKAPTGGRGGQNPRTQSGGGRGAPHSNTPTQNYSDLPPGSSVVAPTPPSATNRFLTSAVGLPEGTSLNDLYEGGKQELQHPLDTASNVVSNTVSGLNPWAGHSEAAQMGIDRMHKPGFGNTVAGVGEYLESGIPFIGPSMVRSGEKLQSGDIAGGAGEMVTPSLIAAGMARGGVTPKSMGEAAARVIEAPGEIRKNIGASYHDPETGKLTPGARQTARAIGSVAGGAIGTALPIPGAGPTGAVAGGFAGPALFDRAFPEPEYQRIAREANANYEQKGADLMRRQAQQDTIDRAAARSRGSLTPIEQLRGEEGIKGSIQNPSGRIIRLPSELETDPQGNLRPVGYGQAKMRAHENGMSYSSGSRPAFGGKVPARATPTMTTERLPTGEVIHFDELGRPFDEDGNPIKQ
jgi:uncharacterized protein YcfJ